jgi:hypothetical protein
MNKRFNLSEFFVGIISLFFIALISIASQYDEMESSEDYCREYSVEYFTWELKEYLNLSERQEVKIKEINYDFYDKISQLKKMDDGDADRIDHEIDILVSKRNIRVVEVLNESQKEILTNTEFFVLAKKEND